MLKIRLARTGKKKQAQYRVVVADQKRAVTAKFVEILGWYNPHTKEIKINTEKVQGWLEKGAQPSNTIAKLLKTEGSVKLPSWVKIEEKNKKPKKEVEEKPEATAAESAEAEVTEAEVEAEIAEESDFAEATTDKESTESEIAEKIPAEVETAEESESDSNEATTDKETKEG